MDAPRRRAVRGANRIARHLSSIRVESSYESEYNETAPLYLLMAYAKAAQENPSPAAIAILAKLAEAAKAGIKAKQTEK